MTAAIWVTLGFIGLLAVAAVTIFLVWVFIGLFTSGDIDSLERKVADLKRDVDNLELEVEFLKSRAELRQK